MVIKKKDLFNFCAYLYAEKLRLTLFGSAGRGRILDVYLTHGRTGSSRDSLCVTHFILTCEGLRQRLAAAEVAEQEGIRGRRGSGAASDAPVCFTYGPSLLETHRPGFYWIPRRRETLM